MSGGIRPSSGRDRLKESSFEYLSKVLNKYYLDIINLNMCGTWYFLLFKETIKKKNAPHEMIRLNLFLPSNSAAASRPPVAETTTAGI